MTYCVYNLQQYTQYPVWNNNDYMVPLNNNSDKWRLLIYYYARLVSSASLGGLILTRQGMPLRQLHLRNPRYRYSLPCCQDFVCVLDLSSDWTNFPIADFTPINHYNLL